MQPFFKGTSGNNFADRRYELALQMAGERNYAAAADLLRQGLELTPDWPPLHFHLGEVLRQAERPRDAMKSFLAYLALDPNDCMGAIVKLVLMGFMPAPGTMPQGYVQSLFDQFAPRFEETLIKVLDYHVPEFMAEKIMAIRPGPFERLLDLGCGTGLAAGYFEGQAAWMEGVDLSPVMIEHARIKLFYNALYVSDVEEFLSGVHTAYDIVLCADVFGYIGMLDDIFKKTAALMENGALFAFSVQTLENGDWALGEDHRYAQSKPYIENCMKDAGLKFLSCDHFILRQDAGHPVPGMMFVCEK